MAIVKVHNAEEFKKEVRESEIPVIVDFYADWCGPCKMLGPLFEKVSGDYTDKVKFVKINVDEVGDIAAEFNVMSIPTLIIVKGGEVVDQKMGALPEPMLKGWVESQIEAEEKAA